MSEDILADWKKNRFIVADTDLVDDGAILIVMSDYRFWAAHVDECIEWCNQNNAKIQGMTIVLPDEATLLLFTLRWAGPNKT